MLHDRARVLASIGKHDEAVTDADRMMEFTSDTILRGYYGVDRAMVLALASDYEAAVAQATKALEELEAYGNPRSIGPCYVTAAKVCARAAALVQADTNRTPDDRDRLFREYAASSITMLRSALEAKRPSDQDPLASEEFAVLRDHPEFVALLDRKPDASDDK